ncbi:MAG: amino acid adenylation domain-containing protein [bacterium]|nr:amino acid adenylation domain-containing protein [bacterium]
MAVATTFLKPTATVLAARIHKELGIDFPLKRIFSTPTIRGMANYIRKSRKRPPPPPIKRAKKQVYYPLTSAQKRLFVLNRLEKNMTGYNMPEVLQVEGPLIAVRLEQAFYKLILRHEALRTSFHIIEGEPVQKVHKDVPFEITHFHLNRDGDEAGIIEAFICQFDLSRPPLLRVGLIKKSASQHILLFDMHHIISDGASRQIIMSELSALYGGNTLPAKGIHYKDYVMWQKQTVTPKAVAVMESYWKQVFSGDIPVLDLCPDFPGAAVSQAHQIHFNMSKARYRQFKQTATRRDATPFMMLSAVLAIVLSRYSGQEDIVIGTASSGRRHPDVMGLVGLFANTFGLRHRPLADKPFVQFLDEVREHTLTAFENQDYPLEHLAETLQLGRSLSRNPLFDVMLVMQAADTREGDTGNLTLERDEYGTTSAAFQLVLNCREEEDQLFFTLEYSSALFKKETILRMVSHFLGITATVTADGNISLGEIEILSPREKRQLLEEFNGKTVQYTGPATIHGLFAQQVQKTPHCPALVAAGVEPTYLDLKLRAERAAKVIKTTGLPPGAIIALLPGSTLETAVALLAILHTGAAFLLIEPTDPVERIRCILADSGASMLIAPPAREIPFDRHILHWDLLACTKETPGTSDIKPGDVSPEKISTHTREKSSGQNTGQTIDDVGPEETLTGDSQVPGNQPAYAIYTSGTTGRPKGVLVEHRSAVNTLVHRREFYNFKEDTTALQLFSPGFDGFVTAFFTPLISGARLVMPDAADIKEIHYIKETLLRYRVNYLLCVPALFNGLLELPDPHYIAGLHTVTLAGDRVPPGIPAAARAKNKDLQIVNEYGVCEAAVLSTLCPLSEDETPVAIGRPISNTSVYIVDKRMQLQPVGVPGELCISGSGLARGYLNNPTKTAAKFLPDTFKPANKHLYRTGDLARYLPDGRLQFLGRIDFQVKIRGYRIELEEVESQINTHAGVLRSVSAVKNDTAGHPHLCAYVVFRPAGGEPTGRQAAQLREYLLTRLPSYMVPAFYIAMEQLPVTALGKIDRSRLPEPPANPATGTEYEAPRNDVETKLADMWRKLLKLEQVNIHDHFFHIGGNSLKASMLSTRIHRKFRVRFPLRELFNAPTVAGMAQYIKENEKELYAAIEPAPPQKHYPLSAAQKRLFTIYRMESKTGDVSYNMHAAVSLTGHLVPERLEKAFQALVERHQVLRTSFHIAGDEPVQRVHKDVDFKIKFYDISGPHTTFKPGKISGQISAFIRHFDLSAAPLFRVGLIKVESKRRILMIDMHHIVADGISIDIIVKEAVDHYSGKTLPPLRLHYKDYALWQAKLTRSGVLARQEVFWKSVFPGPPPVLELPLDFPRPVERDSAGGTVYLTAPPELSETLTAIARQYSITTFTFLLASYSILLSMYSGREDIIVGTVTAGRPHVDLETIVGMFANTLALRLHPTGNTPFAQLLTDTSIITLKAFENQDFQFENLVDTLDIRRDLGRNPLFDTMFTLRENTHVDIAVPDLEVTPYEHYDNNVAKFDLTLNAAETSQGLSFTFQYCRKLFKHKSMERMASHFLNILQQVAADSQIEIRKINLLNREERHRLVVQCNETARPYPKDRTIHQLFLEQVDRTPDKIAAANKHLQLTYAAMNENAEKLATVLRRLAGHDRACPVIALVAGPSPTMAVGIMGILKTGAAYLPIDPCYPPTRIAYLLKDSNVRILVTTLPARNQLIFHREIVHLSPGLLSQIPYAPDHGESKGDTPIKIAGQMQAPPLFDPGSPAYVMYTSGTIGKPKGVIVEHANVVRLVKNNNFITFQPEDRILQTGAVVFDAITFEIWGALLNGLRLFLPAAESVPDEFQLAETIVKQRISILWLTSLLFNHLAEQAPELFRPLRCLLVGGDVVSPRHVRTVKNACPHLQVINGYGPTENTTFSTTFPIEGPFDAGIPIGKPIASSTAYILDTYLRVLPYGVVGELYVGGDGVARGYLNKPELTAKKFIFLDITAAHKPPVRLYRTGDMCRRLPCGNIEFVGRLDQQVKIRGFRIECAEVETEIRRFDGIEDVAVLPRIDKNNDKYLCAYIVPQGHFSQHLTMPGRLKRYLQENLPHYMIPALVVNMEKFPMTFTGKIDRCALPEPEDHSYSGVSYQAPGDELELHLVLIWRSILKIERIGIHDNFFDIGGHSLKATMLASRVYKELSARITLGDIFRNPTINELAAIVRRIRFTFYASIEPVEDADYYPVSSAQKRMFALNLMEGDGAGTAYNIPIVLLVEGNPDLLRLETIFLELIERHEAFRTCFTVRDGRPVQRILSPREIRFSINRYYILDSCEETAAGISAEDIEDFTGEFIRPFDLSGMPPPGDSAPASGFPDETEVSPENDDRRTPLLRVGLVSAGGNQVLLMVDMHHIISDGASMEILTQEFFALYADEDLPPLRVRYRDYAVWQQDPAKWKQPDLQENFWKKTLSGQLPVLVLPYDFPRPTIRRFDGAVEQFKLDETLHRRLHTAASRKNSTLNIILLAAYNVLLAKYSGQEDILVGIPETGRPHPELEPVIGMFVNTLVMRNYPSMKKSFTIFLGEVRDQSLRAYENRDFQFEKLVEILEPERDLGRNPLFDTMMVLRNSEAETNEEAPDVHEINGLRFKSCAFKNKASPFDITLSCFERGTEIPFSLQYCTSLFKSETIRRMAGHFVNIIEQVLEHPVLRMIEIDPLSPGEKQLLLEEFNATSHELPTGCLIHHPVEEQAQKTPDSPALVYNDHTLSYRVLIEQSERLARSLKNEGVVAGTVVAVLVSHPQAVAAAILGVLKSGGIYLPIEPSHPAERIRYIPADSGAAVLLTDGPLLKKPDFPLTVIHIPDILCPSAASSAPAVRPPLSSSDKVASAGGIPSTTDGENRAAAGEEESLSGSGARRHNDHEIAYIIYTSGTTGRPKGVAVSHANAVNTLLYRRSRYRVNPDHISLPLFSYAFDGFVTGFFTPLISGARLVSAGSRDIRDIDWIRRSIRDHQVTHLLCVPVLCHLLLRQFNPKEIESLRVVTLAGDAFSPQLLEELYALKKDLEVVNEYGVSEAAVLSTLHKCKPGDPEIKIGHPIWNTDIYILNPFNRIQPPGVPGELCIGGAGVASGYINNPELTAAKFIPSPFKPHPVPSPTCNGGPGGASNTIDLSKPDVGTNLQPEGPLGFQGAPPFGLPAGPPEAKAERLYKTGDLACRQADGSIRFLGRIDWQVKIRGYRIEPGEIEVHLASHPSIKEAVVTTRPDVDGARLCAYIVPHARQDGAERLDIPTLRAYLAGLLPDYMLPAYFLQLKRLPLSPSGKVDRKKLPEPAGFMKTGTTYAPPRNDLESRLVDIWRQLLEHRPLGIDHHFFRVGGDSIKAIQVSARLRQFGFLLKVNDIYRNPTIRRLVHCIHKKKRRIPQKAVQGAVQLTPIQCWFFREHPDFHDGFCQSVMLFRPEGRPPHLTKSSSPGDVEKIPDHAAESPARARVDSHHVSGAPSNVSGAPQQAIGSQANAIGPQVNAIGPQVNAIEFREDLLEKVFARLMKHHDVLRMVFKSRPGSEGPPSVSQYNHGPGEPAFQLQVFHIESNESASDPATRAREICGRFRLDTGPLLKAALFKTAAGDHLLLAAHHLIMDGMSWRILLEDFATLYTQALQKNPLILPEKTDSYKYWAEKMFAYAGGAPAGGGKTLQEELLYWLGINETELEPLPPHRDIPKEHRTQQHFDTLSLAMEKDDTARLLTGVHRAYNTEINDILLTALALALKQWAGISQIAVNLEGHGREAVFPQDELDVSRTIGWFTSQYPVILDVAGDKDIGYRLKFIKETLRRIPNKGVGYGILKYLSPDSLKQDFHPHLRPPISFNYLGQVSASGGPFGHATPSGKRPRNGASDPPCPDLWNPNGPSGGMLETNVGNSIAGGVWTISPFNIGSTSHPQLRRNEDLAITSLAVDGIFSFSFDFNRHRFERDAVQQLAQTFKATLLNLIHHCLGKEKSEHTPSDLGLPFLTIGELETLPAVEDIQAVYPLSPMQAGMLFHTLMDRETGGSTYIEQTQLELAGDVDEDLLEQCLNRLVARYDILRTRFFYKDLRQPLQAVFQTAHIQLQREDISHLSGEDQERFLEKRNRECRARGFDLSGEIPMRTAITRTGPHSRRLDWCHHHIIMDGWCLGILSRDLLELYAALKEGREPHLPFPVPYKNYIDRLAGLNRSAGLETWKNYLGGYEGTNLIPSCHQAPGTAYRLEEYQLTIDRELSARLRAIASSAGTTLNILFRCLWGILLQRCNYTRDVMFGAVVSGRPAEIEGIEDMVGLFINTVPVRITTIGSEPFAQFLARVTRETRLLQPYEFLPTTDIRKSTPGPNIDHILAFESRPMAEAVKSAGEAITPGFRIESVRVREQTNYDFNVIVGPGIELLVRMSFNAAVYVPQAIKSLARGLKQLIRCVAEREQKADYPLSDLGLASQDEKREILEFFNTPHVVLPSDITLWQLFARQVEIHADAAALVGPAASTAPAPETPDDGQCLTLTYRTVARKVRQLAEVLVSRGLRTGDIVAVFLAPSIDTVIAALAVMEAGGAYFPIEPITPFHRIRYILRDAGSGFFITECKFNETARALAQELREMSIVLVPPPPNGKDKATQIPSPPAEQSKAFGSAEPPAYGPGFRPLEAIAAQDVSLPAYIIYTSGSTGRPKGVLVRHANISPLIRWGQRTMNLGPHNSTIRMVSYSFDWSVWEMFITLSSGARLHMVADEIARNPEKCLEYICGKQITVLHVTPSQLSPLLDTDSPHAPRTLTRLCIGGERLGMDMIRKVRQQMAAHPNCRVFNMYGPTETTIIAAVEEIDLSNPQRYESIPSIPIGKPIANNRLFVLDQDANLCPVYAAGRLVIAGDGPADGYLNHARKTAETFVENPAPPTCEDENALSQGVKCSPSHGVGIAPSPGPGITHRETNYPHNVRRALPQNIGRIFITGDKVRWLPGGRLEFLDRLDSQVKIRGMRIEPGEIESRLLTHPGLKKAIVTARHEKIRGVYLCAYIVGGHQKDDSITAPALRNFLSKHLPVYMLPSFFVLLEKLPLSPNGKVDRAALPEPDAHHAASGKYEAPRDQLETLLVKTWAEILGTVESPLSICIHDNFFEMGGHSLKAVQVVNLLSKRLKRDIPVNHIFRHPTVSALAVWLRQNETAAYSRIEPLPKMDYYPLSYDQKRLWILYKTEPDATVYTMCNRFPMEEAVDKGAVLKSLQALIRRHHCLRTRFTTVGGEPMQVIENSSHLKLETVDLLSLPPDQAEAGADKTFARLAARPFHLETGPLLRVQLLKHSDSRYELLYAMHHIISDGWSMEVLKREFIRFYNKFKTGESYEPAPLPVRYIDYAAHCNRLLSDSRKMSQAAAYWRSKLSTPLPVMDIPSDATASESNANRDSRGYRAVLPAALKETLRQIALSRGGGVFTVLTAAFSVLLARMTRQDEVAVGIAAAGRDHEDLHQVVGFFVNTLILRSPVSMETSFADLLAAVGEDMIHLLQYREYPLELIVESLKIKYPRVPVFLNMINMADEANGTVGDPAPYFIRRMQESKFDMVFYFNEYPDGIELVCNYRASKYKPGRIQYIVGQYLQLLNLIAEAPQKTCGEYEIFTGKRKLPANLPLKK